MVLASLLVLLGIMLLFSWTAFVGVVRAEWNHPGYEVLRHRNLIAWRAASTTARDYRLTPRGRELAKDLFG